MSTASMLLTSTSTESSRLTRPQAASKGCLTRLKFPPPIITCRNVIDETAPIREQVTSVDLMRPQHGPDGYFVTLTGEYRMQCHETIRHEKFPFSRQALQVRLVCKQPMAKVMLAPYCVVAPLRKFKKEDEITLGLDGSPGALKHSFAQ